MACILAIAIMMTPGCDSTTPKTDEPYSYPTLSPDVLEAGPDAALPLLQVPEDTLNTMTTSAVLETVLRFPYLVVYSTSSTIDGGIDALRAQCNALDELLQRSDAGEVIRSKFEEVTEQGWPSGTARPELRTGFLRALVETI